MTQWWRPGRSATAVAVQQHVVGNALVLHLLPKISPEAQSVGLEVPADQDRDIVVLDVAGQSDVGVWAAAAAILPFRRRGIRLIVCGIAPEHAALAGQWLAQRLRRSVTVAHGPVLRAAGGTLFVHSDPDSGWVRHQRNREPVWESKRFPVPAWEAAANAHRTTSATAVIEPLPGGVWLHDTRNQPSVREHWTRLVTKLPCAPDLMAVVLGCPGTPALAHDDIARFWRDLPAEQRPHTRFVQYGPIEGLTGGASFGQFLADLVDHPVHCLAGLPVGNPETATVRTVHPDGRLGWPVYVTELTFQPRDNEAKAPVPEVIAYRSPEMLAEELSPLVHWYANDAVVEVVPSGLWMRPAGEPAGADVVRSDPARPETHAVVFDDSEPARASRMRSLALDLMARLDPAIREVSRLAPMSAVLAGTVHRDDDLPAAALEMRTDEYPLVRPIGNTSIGNAPIEVALVGEIETAR